MELFQITVGETKVDRHFSLALQPSILLPTFINKLPWLDNGSLQMMFHIKQKMALVSYIRVRVDLYMVKNINLSILTNQIYMGIAKHFLAKRTLLTIRCPNVIKW